MLVSTDAHCTVLSRFVALTCSVTARLPPSRTSRVSVRVQLAAARSDDHVARGVAERAGRRDARTRDVLKNSSTVGSLS